jgi:RNA polymerase sigma-70 factor (ECF subfamily)
MGPEPDDRLLERVIRGDDAAVRELFEAFGPYLRAIVRRGMSDRLRSKFDSDDVVQSVWVQIVRRLRHDDWRLGSPAELPGLLVTIARRRLIDRARQNARLPGPEEPGDFETVPTPGQPRPSQVAQAGDVWGKLLGLCPPEHHEVLRLRRDGFRLEEIAARTGLHEGSVRRVLRNLSRELALSKHPLGHSTDAGGEAGP